MHNYNRYSKLCYKILYVDLGILNKYLTVLLEYIYNIIYACYI